MKKLLKRTMAVLLGLSLVAATAACGKETDPTPPEQVQNQEQETASTGDKDEGISPDSPYAGMGFDLSEHKTVVMYTPCDVPEDIDKVLAEANEKYFHPWLNTTFEVKFISWADLATKYSLILAGSDQVDIMFTGNWCHFTDSIAKGAFRKLDPEWLKKYLPMSYEEQPEVSWDQASVNGVIYGIPKTASIFNNYRFVAVRGDLMEKYGFDRLESYEDFKEYLYAVAADTAETGIYASAQSGGSPEFGERLWWQTENCIKLAPGYDFWYHTHNSEDVPDYDQDVFYQFTSEEFRDFCLEMAQMAKDGIWSKDAINTTTGAREAFPNGTAASMISNTTLYSYGEQLEASGLGTYEAWDITPDIKRPRGVYSDDMVAIPTNCKDPERAALIIDCIKGFSEVNNLINGGIEGVHYNLEEDGSRTLGPDASKYVWGAWAWGLQRNDQPKDASNIGEIEFEEICAAQEFVPKSLGFTFDRTPVETQLAVINSIRDEYYNSFQIGVFGDDTEAKLDEFRKRLEDAGIADVEAEMKKQWLAYCERKGY